LSKTKQEPMSQTQNFMKNRTKLWLSKSREKSVDKNDLSPALTNEVRSRRAWGVFCRKDFCTNFLNTQFILRFLYQFLHLQNLFLLGIWKNLFNCIFHCMVLLCKVWKRLSQFYF
jgi:hypothetical protein